MKDQPFEQGDLTWLAGLARSLLGEAHAAEDLAQEAAAAALRAPAPSHVPRRAWLASITRRLAARHHRSEAHRRAREEWAARYEATPDPTHLVEAAEVAERLAAAVRRLPEPYRRTVLLRYLEGHGTRAIARLEERPVDTVRWQLRRGLALLREELGRGGTREWSAALVPLASLKGAQLASAGASRWLPVALASTTLMKTLLLTVLALALVGVWWTRDAALEPTTDPLAARAEAGGGDAPRTESTALAKVEGDGARLLDGAPLPDAPAVPSPLPTLLRIAGVVVDERGEGLSDATVFVHGAEAGAPPRAETTSGADGGFELELDPAARDVDLGVAANGYLRRSIEGVSKRADRTQLRIVLERGRTLRGRVVDESGSPVAGLELLVHPAYAGIDHVSPSQRRLRARRNVLGRAPYDQCSARTDGRGEIVFTGLPDGKLGVLPLEPGWTIEESRLVDAGEPYVEWTAARRLGAMIVVVDARTGAPVERARATFRLGVEFANGESQDLGQWVGRGRGEVTFVLDPEGLPGFEKRTAVRVEFYGTVAAEDGEPVDWRAEALADAGGVVGVAEVRVEVEPAPAAADTPEPEPGEGTRALDLDVRYADATPFEGELRVRWTAGGKRDSALASRTGVGRYRVDVAAAAPGIEVTARYASGSLPGWSGAVDPESTAPVFVTLPTGATAVIPRPEGWSGEWFVRASFREAADEDWRGSWGYGTDDAELVLPVMRAAEWRFELRRRSAFDADPLVRSARLGEGERVVVD